MGHCHRTKVGAQVLVHRLQALGSGMAALGVEGGVLRPLLHTHVRLGTRIATDQDVRILVEVLKGARR